MFGYVKTVAPELKLREHEYYKGTYCGLCKTLGKCTGQCSRMTLNYDFVMLALLRIALTHEKTSFSSEHCILHHIKKRNVMNKNPELVHCAFSSAIISYHKVRDDICDEGFLKRLYTRLFLLPTASAMRRKTVKKEEYAALDKKCASLLNDISNIEKDSKNHSSVDEPAALFGKLLSELLAHGLCSSEEKIARAIGTHLGKWIYITDALDDMADDLRLGRYNPFLIIYNGSIPTGDQLSDIALALKNELIGLENALDLIDFGADDTVKNIIFNIIYLGMPKKIEEIISKYNNDNDRKEKA